MCGSQTLADFLFLKSVPLYLMAINFHDQRPSPTSTFSNSISGHVTINRDFSTASFERISFISCGPDVYRQQVSKI